VALVSKGFGDNLRSNVVRFVALLVLTPACCLTLGGGEASASHVSCGDTITTDTTLDSDLVDCPSNGIVIGADGITLDLNGHTVDGNGEPVKSCPGREFCDLGLLINRHRGVTVRHGSVRGFGVGVYLQKARRNHVLGISAPRNQFGILIGQSSRNLVRNSSAKRSVEDGLILLDSDHIRVLHSSFRKNRNFGIGVFKKSSSNLIKGNLFASNDGSAIVIEKGDRNRVTRNRCVRTASCVIVAPGNRNAIARNRVSGGGDAIRIEKGDGNLVARNVIVDARGTGIRLGLQAPLIGGADNVVRRNRVRGSRDDAFLVDEKDDHSLLRSNVAVGAGDDGFEVRSHTTKLTGNRAGGNAELGIKAVPGVIDGGGNKAGGNGDPRQCTNVACN
jgi:nitrous oxidase accessory protein NosD